MLTGSRFRFRFCSLNVFSSATAYLKQAHRFGLTLSLLISQTTLIRTQKTRRLMKKLLKKQYTISPMLMQFWILCGTLKSLYTRQMLCLRGLCTGSMHDPYIMMTTRRSSFVTGLDLYLEFATGRQSCPEAPRTSPRNDQYSQ